jgi:hypothetical protein
VESLEKRLGYKEVNPRTEKIYNQASRFIWAANGVMLTAVSNFFFISYAGKFCNLFEKIKMPEPECWKLFGALSLAEFLAAKRIGYYIIKKCGYIDDYRRGAAPKEESSVVERQQSFSYEKEELPIGEHALAEK